MEMLKFYFGGLLVTYYLYKLNKMGCIIKLSNGEFFFINPKDPDWAVCTYQSQHVFNLYHFGRTLQRAKKRYHQGVGW